MTTHTKRALMLICAALLALGIAGCGDEAEQPASDESAAAMEKADSEQAAMEKEAMEKKAMEAEAMAKEDAKPKSGQVRISASTVEPYGKMLQNGKGLTIYLFTKEKSSRSECYGECAEAWPPVTTKGEAFAGKGIDEKLLGTTKRRDGTTQVTYNDHPLYYYRGETQRDQVLCQAVPEFGGIWYVVSPKGDEITTIS